MAHIIDGKLLANNLIDELKKDIAKHPQKRSPGLATVLVGNDRASAIYVAHKIRRAKEVGITSIHHTLSVTSTQSELLMLIEDLNHDPSIDGILIQLPLPQHIDENKILDSLDPNKDVDGFHPLNLGYLMRGDPRIVACTPLGVMHIIRSVHYNLKGKHAVVIGRSTIVGKPLAHLLLQAGATITICHRETKNLADITKHADLVAVAVGKAKMINHTHVRKGTFIIDVGINRDENNTLCGDVDFLDVIDLASYITPVPGGVGPLTIAMLLKNTFANFMRMTS
jgi:methylenetetrahydrofolate dehydrogenase (NADP+)/methenyltetrahydrofolate cyclohydrolase